ncbi:MAG: ATP-dependent helicase [Lachnospiraceae bacterium]|nr:ATP-dependent helicase [Lachnospiraceae bacterium]
MKTDIFSGLSPEQKKAVCHKDGPMMVLAGPGSGKTFVITRRIAYMVREHKIDPGRILVITFTKAAALEMEERYLSLCGDEGSDVSFGTFHAIFFGILKECFHFNRSNIVDEPEKRRYLKSVLSGYDNVEDDDATIDELLHIFSVLKNDGRPPESYDASGGILEQRDLTAIYKEYHDILKSEHKLDFDDMVLDTCRLFSDRPEILAVWQKRYRYILVDEFQDINPMQYKVVRMLARPENNLFIVGDDDQSIYGFRSADPGIMLGFPKDYPEAERVVLKDNYRSTTPIVGAALRLVGNNRARFIKKLKAKRKGEKAVFVSGFGGRSAEAEAICGLVAGARRHMNYKDMALLFRTNSGAKYYSRALSAAGIPFYIKEKTGSIFSEETAKDMMAILAFVNGDNSRKNFLRFMNKPMRYIRRASLTEETVDLTLLTKNGTYKAAAAAHIRMLGFHLENLKDMPVYAALMYIRKGMGYEAWARADAAAKGKDIQELEEQLDFICDSAKEHDSYRDWLESIAAYEKDLKESSREKDRDAVQLMTMHGSKGLEYSMVILPDVNEGLIPQKKAKEDKEIEEERRIFYVAMTRAKDKLFIFYQKKSAGGNIKPSRFIKEAGL